MASNIPIFVTNLKGTDHRKEHMIKQMKSLDLEFEFIDCIDGRQWTDEKVKSLVSERLYSIRNNNKGWLTNGAIAATKTHLELIFKRMIDEDINYALCMEDDVLLPANFKTSIYHIFDILETNKVEGVVLLHYHIAKDKTIQIKGNELLISDDQPNLIYRVMSLQALGSGACYIISKNTAEKIYNDQKPIKRIGDWWHDHQKEGALENLYLTHPLTVKAGVFESILGYTDMGIKSKIAAVLKKTKLGRYIIYRMRKSSSGKVEIID
jgi:glycosyl transferase family 25